MNIGSFSVSLQVRHPTLAAHELVNAFDLKARISQDVGHPKMSPKGLVLTGVYSDSYCNFPFKKDKLDKIIVTFEELVVHLRRRASVIDSIVKSGAKIRCAIGIFECDNYGFDINPDVSEVFSEFGISISLYIYAADGSDPS